MSEPNFAESSGPTSHRVLTPHVVRAVIEEAVAADDRDLARGGVHSSTIQHRLAEDYDLSREPKTVRDYLREHRDQLDLAEVRGLNPETLVPRVSWLPTEHPDLSPVHLADEES